MVVVHNEAAWIPSKHAKLEVKEAPLWTPGPGEVLIKNHAIAVNPCEWKIQEWGIFLEDQHYPGILGGDVAGTIEAVGPGVEGFSKGDRVLSYTCPLTSEGQSKAKLDKVVLETDTRFGAFQKFSISRAHLTTKIPDYISFSDACVLPTGAATAAHGLFAKTHLNLQRPVVHKKDNSLSNKSLLVWGAGSSVGACAVQLVANAGYTVIATASPSNHQLVLSMGAAAVFDYRDSDVVAKLQAAVKGEWIGAFDAISENGTIEQCATVIGKGLLITTLPPPSDLPARINAKGVFAGILWNVEKEIGSWLFREYFTTALQEKSFILTPPPLVIGHGLDKVQEGLEAQKTVSGRKIVILLGDH